MSYARKIVEREEKRFPKQKEEIQLRVAKLLLEDLDKVIMELAGLSSKALTIELGDVSITIDDANEDLILARRKIIKRFTSLQARLKFHIWRDYEV